MKSWKRYERKMALQLITEAENYIVRNKNTYKKVKGDSLFNDVHLSKKIIDRRQSTTETES